MVSFGVNNLLNQAKSTVTQYLGISDSDIIMSPIYTSRDMASDYFLVTIDSSANGSTQFRLPDSFSVSLKSTFSSLVEGKMGIVSSINKMLQAISPFTGSMFSLNTKFSTAQIWEGSSPVSITLPIELHANSSVNDEVFSKIKLLSNLVLPREGGENGKPQKFTDVFLRAPGPTPIDIKNDSTLQALKEESAVQSFSEDIDNLKYVPDLVKSGLKQALNYLASGVKYLEKTEAGDIIDITIGNIMKFRRCIVTDIQWDFDCTRLLNGSGLPLHVSGKLTFKTSTAMTVQDFTKSIEELHKPITMDLGNLGSDLLKLGTDVWNNASEEGGKAIGAMKDKFKSWG